MSTDDEKIRRARAALAQHDELLALQLQATGGEVNRASVRYQLAEALRAFLPGPTFEVWEVVSVRGCREEHAAVATGLETREGAQYYIARTDPEGKRRLYVREQS